MENVDEWTKACDIHSQVLSNFTYVHDQTNYGKVEDWRLPEDFSDIRDDCDGFALAARHLCDRAGLETRLVICTTENGEYHLVCAVGNFILDNRHSRLKTKSSLERLGYEWIAVSGKTPGEQWKTVGGT